MNAEYPALIERRQWMLFDRENKAKRRPAGWDADREQLDWSASWKDPSDWLTYDQAVAAAATKDSYGIGFVFSELDPWIAIDLDGCLRDDSGPKEWMPSLDPFLGETVIERSAGGDGVHVLVEVAQDKGLPDWWTDVDFADREHEGVEAYESKFMTVTGDLLFAGDENAPPDADTTEIGTIESHVLDEWLAGASEAVTGVDPRETAEPEASSSERRAAPSGDTDVPTLSVYDVRGVSKSKYPPDERGPHPVHASGTGANFSVDEGGETWRCWHGGHNCTGNAYHLIGVDAGIIDCGQWSDNGLDAQTWREIFDAARERGHNVPERTKPAPLNAAEEVQVMADGSADTAAAGESATDDPEQPSLSVSFEGELQRHVVSRIDPDDEDDSGISMKVAIDRAARIFDQHLDFVLPRRETRGWREQLYIYIDGEIVGTESDKGVYEPVGGPEVRRLAERHFGAIANDSFVRELTNKLGRRNWTRAKKLEANPERLVVGNGVLDLTTGELTEFSPAEYHLSKLRIDWPDDPESTSCDRIDEFLHNVVPEEHVDTLYRFIAHCLYREYAAEKALMLLGDGANGKSMFLELVETFVGEFNVSHRSLQDITDYRWAANDLVGRMANVHADMSDQNVDSLKMFKHATGGDTIDADVKFESPVKFTNYATMLFACNDLPVLNDDTRGNWRRWVLVDFPYTFDNEDPAARDATPKRVLRDELFTDAEFQGLLVRCVEEIKEWRTGRAWFPDVPGWQETRSRMRRASEPMFAFADACLVEVDSDDQEEFVSKDRMRDAYRAFATQEGLPKMGREELGRKLQALTDYDIQTARPRADGARTRVYSGVQLNQYARTLLGEAEEDTKTDQSTLPPETAVLYVLRDGDKDGMPIKVLLDRVRDEHGIDRGRAEHALGTLAERGDVIEEERYGSRWFIDTNWV